MCLAYITKHNKWPPIVKENIPDSNPLKAFIDNDQRSIRDYENIHLSHWNDITIKGVFELDTKQDYTTLLADKSLGTYLPEDETNYNADMMGHSPKMTRTTSRRVLEEVIKRERLRIDEILEMIKRRELSYKHFFIKLSPKERELSIKPRLFAMMTLEMRLYFCCTEDNLAKQLFKYLPQQSMTMNESTLSKHMDVFSKLGSRDSYVEMFIGIDFSKWNLHWTYSNTAVFLKFLDELYDCGDLFIFTHEFFQKCEMSLSSLYRIPEEYMNGGGR